VFGVALFSNRDPIFPTPLWTPSVCIAVITHYIAWLGEFRLAIINSLISAELARSALENIIHLRKNLVILKPQVAIGQRLNAKKS
jgi:hypothetical protein